LPFEKRRNDNGTRPVAITHFPSIVGRQSSCDQRIGNERVSRRHCTFFLQDDQVYVRDLGSLNGTHLNGRPVEAPQPVHEGDVLTLAGVSFEVHLPAKPAAPVVEPATLEQATQAPG
jgi:pSer/pThr/pTyr-binding forkhead associated (FHA) protein